jgi:uncharacterized glyoxalase superfamily protein PhnB
MRRLRKEQFAVMQSLIPALAVKDIPTSLSFYNDVLGFETTFTLPDDNGNIVHASLKRGDVEIMLGLLDLTQAHNQGALGKGVLLYTTVADNEDVDALYEHAKRQGAQVTQEPVDQFWGHREWIVADPDGYLMAVSKVIAQVTADSMREAMAGAPAD